MGSVGAVARLAELMAEEPVITPLAPGTFRVEVGGKREIVYVAGPLTDRWTFWNGHVFHFDGVPEQTRQPEAIWRSPIAQSLSAPMPATVIRVLVAAGGRVKKGDTVVVLEAMKMELPIRSLSDGTIAAVHCHEGELVKADQLLIEMESPGRSLSEEPMSP
jgi:acetyl/propionyl-CoA carboxylase alpha subunit